MLWYRTYTRTLANGEMITFSQLTWSCFHQFVKNHSNSRTILIIPSDCSMERKSSPLTGDKSVDEERTLVFHSTPSPSPTSSETKQFSSQAQPCQIRQDGYVLGAYDVICGRGNQCRDHHGNIFFRKVIEKNLANYVQAKTKSDKSNVVSQIVDAVRKEGGDFVRIEESNERWCPVSERALREKVGQSLRDVLHTQYRSSNKAKKRRKKVENAQQHEDVNSLLGPNSVIAKLGNQIKDETPDFQAYHMFVTANARLLQDLKNRMAQSSYAGAHIYSHAHRIDR